MNIPELKKKKDLLFHGILALIGCGVMYYIFFVDGRQGTTEQPTARLISELPDGNVDPMPTKKAAYENARYEESKPEKMKSLDDYLFRLTREASDAPDGAPREAPGAEPIPFSGASEKPLVTSNHRIYDDFDLLAEENDRLRDDLDRLRREKKNNQSNLLEKEKLEVLKQVARSFAKQELPEPVVIRDEHAGAARVRGEEKELVTTLSDDLYLDRPYNAGFITAVGASGETARNTIRAVIHEGVTVRDGSRVMLRLTEPLRAGDITVERNRRIAGTARIQGDRLHIIISSIACEGNIIPVHVKVFDSDGVEGIYAPSAATVTAAKEAAADVSTSLGSISVARSITDQIAMDATRSLLQGGSRLLSKKARTEKVTLRENYRVLLVPQK